MIDKDLYPCPQRDEYEKIGYTVDSVGEDSIYTVVPQGPSESAGAADPVAAPTNPEGHAEGYGDHVGSGSDNPKPGPSA